MSGCLASLETDTKAAVGDTAKMARHVWEQGLSPELNYEAHSRIAWACSTESGTDPGLLGRVFTAQPSTGCWKKN